MATATRSEGISLTYALQYLERWRSNGLSLTLQKNEDVPNALFDNQVRSLLAELASRAERPEVKLLFAPGVDGEHTLLTCRVTGVGYNRVFFADNDSVNLRDLIAVFVRLT